MSRVTQKDKKGGGKGSTASSAGSGQESRPTYQATYQATAVSTPAGSGQAPPTVVEQPMVTPPPKATDKLTRGGQSSGRPGQIVTAANRWRENYNPMRNLTMRRVVELLELGQRGDYAYLQWAYRFIERRNPTLSGLVSRCEAPLTGFDWSVKIKSTLPAGGTPAMAEKQKEILTDAYNNIDNLRDALTHLHSANFRGYAHLQKHRDNDGEVYHLEPLHQWCICRDGLEGNWFWNPDSRSTSQPLQFLGVKYCIGSDNLPLEDFIIRECPRPIDEIALIDTVRRGLCDKDWDAFIEIYGIPGGVVIMPAEVPQGQEDKYEQAAKSIAEGSTGALPYGSDYKPNDGPRNVDPFTPRLAHLDEQLVLAGTAGKLAMLTEKTAGSRGNSKVHDDTFNEVANGRAKECAEKFQHQFDQEVLDRKCPGQPICVYFDFGVTDEADVSELCTNVQALTVSGYEVDDAWLSEETGYPITKSVVPPPPEIDPVTGQPIQQPLRQAQGGTPAQGLPNQPKPGARTNAAPKPGDREPLQPKLGQSGSSALPDKKVTNRAPGLLDPHELAATLHGMLFPVLKRLQAIADVSDSVLQLHMLQKLLEDEPQIAKAILADNSLAKQLAPALEKELLATLAANPSTGSGQALSAAEGQAHQES